ncbi:MAG: TetR/AcrR family transcriptional regulator [Candidatus Abyssobacteria bacterium SURF_17]|uniref:TetR/AcrR family transcriptional regulator n=1 Tax=Candidatus Abyssobacteria bacterium SURF_17 TaxID=2093361 RepID=A0A419EY65_9BACT|nr:MAG: TetR/AcrR family transcriptional regulator [Candidatus Abyssubacteria bacterium SURF_17]
MIRPEKKRITRQRLIEAAAIEFAETGYARANVSTISVRAGYAKGTVYNYFRSKHDLLLAVVEHAMNLLTQEIRTEIEGIDDPAQKLRRGLEVDFQFMVQNELLSKVIIREGFAADPEKQKEFFVSLEPISTLVQEILEEGKRRSRFRPDVDSGLATLVAQGIVGYLLLARWTLEDNRLTHHQLADLAVKCFVEGILTR